MSELTNTDEQKFGVEATEQSQGFEPMVMAFPDPPKDLDEKYEGISPSQAADFVAGRCNSTLIA